MPSLSAETLLGRPRCKSGFRFAMDKETVTDIEPLVFMGLIGASIAIGSTEIWYSDGSPKSESDLMRVPWVRKHLRQEYREREAWKLARLTHKPE